MAYVPGESLRIRLQREGQLPVDEAVWIASETAAALRAAHRDGVVHRDIKPENLLLAGDRVYVADFGIAKALLETGGERLTSTGMALGTPAYMSPEQAGAGAVDARTDQYGLACVLYEMLTGEPPFTGPTAQVVVARRMTEPARAIRPVRPAVPAGVESAVLRGLERIPADRLPDIAAFAEHRTHPPAPRHRAGARAPATAMLLLLAVAAGAWLMAGGTRARAIAIRRSSPSTGEACTRTSSAPPHRSGRPFGCSPHCGRARLDLRRRVVGARQGIRSGLRAALRLLRCRP
jgi:serine/threonine-protein kinase